MQLVPEVYLLPVIFWSQKELNGIFMVHSWNHKKKLLSISLTFLHSYFHWQECFLCVTAHSHFHISELRPVRIVTRAFTKTHMDESFENKPSSNCQENIYWRRWLSSLFHPRRDLRLPRPCPGSIHTPPNSCWKQVCVTGPLGGSQQGLGAVKSRPLQPWTAPPLSQSQRGKDLNLEWPHQAKSPMGSSAGQSSGSPHP